MNYFSKHCLFLNILICLLSACGQVTMDDRRKNTMKGIVKALSICDSAKLYNLIDTSFYFSINGKDGFDVETKRLCESFSENSIKYSNSNFIDTVGIPNTKCYQITLL